MFYTLLAFGRDCSPNSVAHVMQAHLATEKHFATLTSSESKTDEPFAFTAVRESIYSESFLMIPQDGSGLGIAWAKIDELGEATARLFKKHLDSPDTFEHKNRIILLSGPKVWSIAETLQVAGKVVGKEVGIKQVGIEEYTNDQVVIGQLGSHGPGEVPTQWLTSFEAVKCGETAVISGELGKLLGREPETFEETVRAMARV